MYVAQMDEMRLLWRGPLYSSVSLGLRKYCVLMATALPLNVL
jgi:hypothetical protein